MNVYHLLTYVSLIGVALELIKRAIRFVYDRRTIRG